MYGEVVLAPIHAVVKHPKGLSPVEAASIWMMFVAAYGALIEDAKITSEDAVVIPGGLEMNGDSYRLKHSKRRVCDDQPPQESGQNCSARCATTLDIRCNSEGEIPLALLLPEVKPRFPQPLKLMHFHSGPLMYFCSGVDTDLIVTVNLKDFPTAALSSQGIVAAHPDPFVDYLFDLDEPEAIDAVARMRSRLRAPSLSPDDFIASIAQVGMPLTASRLRNLSNRI